MPLRYRGPIARHIVREQLGMISRKRLQTKAARRSNIERFLGIEEDSESSPEPVTTPDNPQREQKQDKSATERVDVDDIVDPARLRMYLKEALDMMNKSDCTDSPMLRDLLASRPNAAASRAAVISNKIKQKYYALVSQMYAGKQTGVSSDDLSHALTTFLPDIEELAALPSPNALKLAYDLLIQLRNSSYGSVKDVPHASGKGNRADRPCDELQVKILRQRLTKGQTWDWDADWINVEDEGSYLKKRFGIGEWYPETKKALAALSRG